MLGLTLTVWVNLFSMRAFAVSLFIRGDTCFLFELAGSLGEIEV